MLNLFEYFDFRQYLLDYYQIKKLNNPSFSYQMFTEKCGFKNKSFIHQIIHSKKKISKSSIFRISKAIGHSKKEAVYFENLVAFNQARTVDEKKHYYKLLTLQNHRSSTKNPVKLITQDYFEYYSKWYHGAIRALIDMYPVKNDYRWLADNLYPPISPKEAKKSIELLQRLDFIKMTRQGYYKVTDKIITTGDEVTSTAVMNFHQQSTHLAHEAINRLPRDQRNITGLMLGISEKTYMEVCNRISNFRKELLELAEKDTNAKMVYQLNFHLFPLSNPRLLRKNPLKENQP